MADTPHVSITSSELPALQAQMHDAQTAAADYYDQTALDVTIEDLGTPVRRFLNAAQAVNELLTGVVSDSATYQEILRSGKHPGVRVVRGVKYVRNIAQHRAHVIKPREPHALIGGTHGLRFYTSWDKVPVAVHDRLHPPTKRLKSDYDTLLKGQDVIQTMLTTLGFLAEVAPDIVHRDHRGEWTGFPLRSQPGVGDRLHPEEPLDVESARAWLNNRKPNGDLRVICGQLTIEQMRYVVGHTFVGRRSYAPFVETVEQLGRDVAADYLYVAGDVRANTTECTDCIPHLVQGAVFECNDDFAVWATPAPSTGWNEDWVDARTADTWHRVLEMEQGGGISEDASYLIRRARRLNAVVPYAP